MNNTVNLLIIIFILLFNISCESSFISNEALTITDIDGNDYEIVEIGNQVWMAENLKVTHYRNGETIPHVSNDGEWSNLSTGAYCSYDNTEDNIAVYGLLYNWYAVNDDRNIAPEGWHIPTDEDWKQLEIYIGMSESEANQTGYDRPNVSTELRSTNGWLGNQNGTNSTRFSAFPGGARLQDGQFIARGSDAYFWTSTEAMEFYSWCRKLSIYNDTIGYINSNMRKGYSVRCVKD